MPPPDPVPLNATGNAPQYADALWGRGTPRPYDEVVDVRSPGEFAEDRVPGAVNLPVLNDDERAEVGTLFNHGGPFAARKLGAALVSANIGRHLRDHFAAKGKDYRPLVYCWRGGQRSASLSIVLAQVGWRVTVLRGGYKTYRAHVRRELDALPPLFTYQVIGGATGTAKTRLLHALAARGAQTLDLEALAHHRGSALGGVGPQPTQKGFESRLLAAFDGLAPESPVWVEAESNRIGDVYLPPALWAQMQSSGGVELQMPTEERVRHLIAEYANLIADPAGLKTHLRRLAGRHAPRQIAEWTRQIDAGDWPGFVASLLELHYDPAYATSAGRNYPHVTRGVTLADAGGAAVEGLAGELAASDCLGPPYTSPTSATGGELR